MKQRMRKLVGMLLILIWLPIYAALVLAVVISRPFLESGIVENGVATFFFYLIAGLAWIIIPALLIRFMQKED